jgi:hypothetical protein
MDLRLARSFLPFERKDAPNLSGADLGYENLSDVDLICPVQRDTNLLAMNVR